MFYAIDEDLICHTIDLTSKLSPSFFNTCGMAKLAEGAMSVDIFETSGENQAFIYFV
jgi:hypothetical protein